jgi:hypothetical protein
MDSQAPKKEHLMKIGIAASAFYFTSRFVFFTRSFASEALKVLKPYKSRRKAASLSV